MQKFIQFAVVCIVFCSAPAYAFTIPNDYDPEMKDCYRYARAYQYYNIAKRTKQKLSSVSEYIKSNYFKDNREIYHFFLQPDLSRYHKRYEFIVEPMQRYAKCIVEIKHSTYTLESCFKMMYLKDLVWAYKNAKSSKEEIHDVLRDQLGRAYYFAETQLKRFVHMPKKKFGRYIKSDFQQCLVNRKEENISGVVKKIISGSTIILDSEGTTMQISFMGMRAAKDKKIDEKAIKMLTENLLDKTISVKYHKSGEDVLYANLEIKGKPFGVELIEKGLTVYHKDDFDSSFFFIKDTYARASANAKLKKLGMWAKKKGK